MTVLSAPIGSRSRAAWESIAGGANNTMVEFRDKAIAGSAAAKADGPSVAVDLFPFRIAIYSAAATDAGNAAATQEPKDADKGPGAASPSRNVMSSEALQEGWAHRRQQSQIFVVAVAHSREEIMADWEKIKDGWRATDGTVDVANWGEFYQRIIFAATSDGLDAGAAEAEAADPAGAGGGGKKKRAEDGDGGDDDLAALISGMLLEDDSAASPHRPPAPSAISPASSASRSPAVTAPGAVAPIEHAAARFTALWCWSQALLSLAACALAAAAWYLREPALLLALVVLAWLPPPLGAPRDHDFHLRVVFEMRRAIEALCGGGGRFAGIAPEAELRSVLASAVLIHFAAVVALDGASPIDGASEHAAAAVGGSLLLGFFVHRVLGLRPPPVPPDVLAEMMIPGSGSGSGSTLESAADRPQSAVRKAGPVVSGASSALVRSVTETPRTNDAPEPLAPTVAAHFELFNSSDWSFVKEKDGVKFFSKSVPWCDKKACKFSMMVPGVTAGTLEHLLTDDPDGTNAQSYAYTFDRLLTKKSVPKKMDTGKRFATVVVHSLYKSPVWGISARDMVTLANPGVYLTPEEQVVHKLIASPHAASGRNVFLQSGTDHGQSFAEKKDFQRGATHCYGMLGQETDDGLLVTLTISVDPCGRIPASIVEITNAEQIEKMLIIRRLLREKGPMAPQLPVPQQRARQKSASGGGIVGGGAPDADPEDEALATDHASRRTQLERLPPQLESAFELINRGDWTHVKHKDGVTFHAVTVPWCDKKACKFSMTVPGVTAATLEAIACDDPEFNNPKSAAFVYDRLLQARKVVARKDTNNVTVLLSYKAPVWGVAPRDLCIDLELRRYLTTAQQAHYQLAADGGSNEVYVQVGADRYDACAEQKGFQRARLFHYALTGRETKTGLEVTLTVSLDPCGSVPAALVEMTNAEQIEKLIKMRQLLRDKGPVDRPRRESMAALEEDSVASRTAFPSTSSGAAVDSEMDLGVSDGAPRERVLRIAVTGMAQSGRATFVATLTNAPMVPPPPHTQQPPIAAHVAGHTVMLHDVRGGVSDPAVASADAVIYFIDSTGSKGLSAAKADVEVLSKLAGDAPILLLGNKTDVTGALTEEQLCAMIPAVAGAAGDTARAMVLFMCSLAAKTGVDAALRWLLTSAMAGTQQQQQQQHARGSKPCERHFLGSTGAAARRAAVASNPRLQNVVMWISRLYHSPDWKLKLEKDGVTYHEMASPFVAPEVRVNAVRFSTFVPGIKAKALDVLLNDLPRVKQFDRLIESKTAVRRGEAPEEDDVIFHSKYKSPVWMVKARDMVTRVTPRCYLAREEQEALDVVPANNARGSGAVFLHVGRDASQEIPPANGFQRAEVHCFGFMAQEEPDRGGVRVTNCFSMDPCGIIPKGIVAASNAEQVQKMLLLRKLLMEMDPRDYA